MQLINPENVNARRTDFADLEHNADLEHDYVRLTGTVRLLTGTVRLLTGTVRLLTGMVRLLTGTLRYTDSA